MGQMLELELDNALTTIREREVLTLLSEGYTTQEIASQLYISYYTVETHRKNLKLKLKARNCAHLVSKALKMGVI